MIKLEDGHYMKQFIHFMLESSSVANDSVLLMCMCHYLPISTPKLMLKSMFVFLVYYILVLVEVCNKYLFGNVFCLVYGEELYIL